jgi:hypothetical protein
MLHPNLFLAEPKEQEILIELIYSVKFLINNS